ncbi:hypothetical protein, partial [Caldifermentibacillus hisashii]|uniref:hypothetical protein n=1 Tax=Caldifermentibacillus hisashii TaxID=996558 RepID=UPI000BC937E5
AKLSHRSAVWDKQAEIQVKMSHRIRQIGFYGTKPPEFEAKLSHRSAVWDKSGRKFKSKIQSISI